MYVRMLTFVKLPVQPPAPLLPWRQWPKGVRGAVSMPATGVANAGIPHVGMVASWPDRFLQHSGTRERHLPVASAAVSQHQACAKSPTAFSGTRLQMPATHYPVQRLIKRSIRWSKDTEKRPWIVTGQYRALHRNNHSSRELPRSAASLVYLFAATSAQLQRGIICAC